VEFRDRGEESNGRGDGEREFPKAESANRWVRGRRSEAETTRDLLMSLPLPTGRQGQVGRGTKA